MFLEFYGILHAANLRHELNARGRRALHYLQKRQQRKSKVN
jgi:hypothetical protein